VIPRDYIDYLRDIHQSACLIEEFVKTITYEEFRADQKTFLASIRCLEIIGEAVKQIPREVRDSCTAIPWKELAGMRDKLIHHYFGVNEAVVWDTVKNEIPAIRIEIEQLLE